MDFEIQSTKKSYEGRTELITHVGMISHHGYFAADPQLGKVDTGGQVVFVLELSKYLHEVCGLKITIFTRLFHEKESPVHAKELEPISKGVKIVRIADRMSTKGFIRKEDLYPYLPEAAEGIIKWITNNEKIDIIHSHYVDGGILGEEVSKKLKIPWVHNSHSLGKVKRDAFVKNLKDKDEIEKIDKHFNFELRFKNEEMMYEKCPQLFAESQDEKTKLLKYYGQKYDKKVTIIPPGVNTEIWHPKLVNSDKHPLNNLFPVKDHRYIFSVSRIDHRKGLDLLIEATPLLREKFDEDIKIVIGGGTKKGRELKPYEKTLHELASKIDPKKDFIYLTGYIPDEDILDYYNGSAVFILPSRWELFGITMLEAMACKKPVIATKFGGPASIIEDGKNGILVDPTNKEELASKIIEVLKDKEKAKNLGKNALKTIIEKYSWLHVAQEYYNYYLQTAKTFNK
ncbi:MAG: glycosyltransferase [Candidatus Hodarchaeota archaeon]